MALLFDRDQGVISRHINNIFKEGELDRESTCAKNAHVRLEGARTITRTMEFYNLDVNVSPSEDTVWLNQEAMALLFDRDQGVISRHINNIFKEGELDRNTSMQKIHKSQNLSNPTHRPRWSLFQLRWRINNRPVCPNSGGVLYLWIRIVLVAKAILFFFENFVIIPFICDSLVAPIVLIYVR